MSGFCPDSPEFKPPVRHSLKQTLICPLFGVVLNRPKNPALESLLGCSSIASNAVRSPVKQMIG